LSGKAILLPRLHSLTVLVIFNEKSALV